jgi:hypothetical protein
LNEKKLSALQLEGVLYACQRHVQRLETGERKGFFLGDGTGVGKGRQCAATILNCIARGRPRHLWFSVSRTLRYDAERDFQDLGAHGVQVIDGCQELDHRSKKTFTKAPQGVLFSTYATLTSSGRKRNNSTRLDAIVNWCLSSSSSSSEFDGVIVFDECHRAKNFVPGKEESSSRVARCVMELQEKLPNARVIYCSATGVSEISNCAFMSRLGLWGKGTAFADYKSFVDDMNRRGVAALELLAMDMKASGAYVSRTLGFTGCDFEIIKTKLSKESLSLYERCTVLWSEIRVGLIDAIQRLDNKTKRTLWSAFWSTHQRFFKQLCLVLKLPYVSLIITSFLFNNNIFFFSSNNNIFLFSLKKKNNNINNKPANKM